MSDAAEYRSRDESAWHRRALTNLAGRMDDIRHIVRCSGVFRLNDVPDPKHHSDDDKRKTRRFCRTMDKLEDCGAIETERVEHVGGQRRRIYRWNRRARADIRAHFYERAELPCGCRAHIPDGRDGPDGWYACSHCGAYHRKAVIMECMT